jgi:hypothetical protein
MIKECAQKFCKECLNKIPEKERDVLFQDPAKFFQNIMNSCYETFNCANMK